MNSYYTNILTKDNKYIGVAYNATNNSVIYATKEWDTQQQALQDLNSYLSSKGEVVATNAIMDALKDKQKIINSNKASTKRCCGR
jgi:hypothetical protein